MCMTWKRALWFCWYLGAVITSDFFCWRREFIMTRPGVEVTGSVRTAAHYRKDGTALPLLSPPRATRGDVQSKTSLPLLQDPFPLNSETDKEEINSEGKDSSMKPPFPSCMVRGCSITSVAIVSLISICFFPSVWLKLGVWLELCVFCRTSLKFRNLRRGGDWWFIWWLWPVLGDSGCVNCNSRMMKEVIVVMLPGGC